MLPIVRMKTPKKFSHPWVFQRMVERATGDQKPKNGSVVDLLDPDGEWVGRGLYNGHSRIAVRLLTEDKSENIDEEFFIGRISRAVELRRHLNKVETVTNAYRMVHSEADGLSGLVIDRFGDLVVIEYFSSGMYRHHKVICDAIKKLVPNCTIYWFAVDHVQKQESIDIRSPALPEPVVIEEHGLKFHVAPGTKHKTGFFCDQRENRKYLSDLVRGGSVLDICCNSGGFAIYAKKLGLSKDVTALDLDEEVLKLAEKNAKLNGADVTFVHSDLFPWLRSAAEKGKKWDVVILDPAKQTKNKEDVGMALKKYCDMNRSAIAVVKPGGILATFSCTGLVSEDEFLESIRRGAFQAKREVQIFKITGAASDHPHLVNVPESRYLKAVWARVW
ncbi:MAG: class I SAM-dependent rRNA methyltransferase [Proteobacteria bacterium]|nr:class I SAM-dependent rRNA methyltransferase [Pseudomonadota bacterium]